MATTAGAGSVWNANSWHWEEKNYTRWSTEYLQQRLAAGTVLAAADGLTIEVAGDVEVKGEASVSIRKQKLILAVDLLLSFRWEAFRGPAAAGDSAAAISDQKVTTASGEAEAEAEAKKGAGGREEATDERQRKGGPHCCCCRGQVKVEDISVDSIEDSDYRLTVSGAPPSETAQASEQERQQCVQLLKKQGAKLLQQILTQYIQRLREAEASAERLAADKRLREEELQRTKVAEETKGEEKKQIAAEEKEKDKLFREQEKIKHVLAGETAAAQPANSSRVTPLEGQGSVWNPSSYHWEEKPMTSWCQATLKERLSSAEFKILDNSTTVKFFNISVEGDASNTIRKGRKLVIFDLSVGADWTATARDEAGVFLADSRGRLEISDFTSETTDDYQVSINGDGKLPAQQRIDSAAKKELPPLLQQLFSQFVQDLRARG